VNEYVVAPGPLTGAPRKKIGELAFAPLNSTKLWGVDASSFVKWSEIFAPAGTLSVVWTNLRFWAPSWAATGF